ncbi:uncharacterized protein EV422DRAFT_545138 [Fimicolochytrium jonesii]|uniref:uncharacterized protein n=1 Tax=Fimicolochytrium jonesii TaxID=1396493 RepID=UPI0022FE5196|nr:uncharacterized protein EV422DRAFT_545138 [Fimicolochytrium jonesii]KAI8816645.1 hypothetical protein EV422DRAFT_545138 [Fimicolochytrium jonesii]
MRPLHTLHRPQQEQILTRRPQYTQQRVRVSALPERPDQVAKPKKRVPAQIRNGGVPNKSHELGHVSGLFSPGGKHVECPQHGDIMCADGQHRNTEPDVHEGDDEIACGVRETEVEGDAVNAVGCADEEDRKGEDTQCGNEGEKTRDEVGVPVARPIACDEDEFDAEALDEGNREGADVPEWFREMRPIRMPTPLIPIAHRIQLQNIAEHERDGPDKHEDVIRGPAAPSSVPPCQRNARRCYQHGQNSNHNIGDDEINPRASHCGRLPCAIMPAVGNEEGAVRKLSPMAVGVIYAAHFWGSYVVVFLLAEGKVGFY